MGFAFGNTIHKMGSIQKYSALILKTNDGGLSWNHVDTMFHINDLFYSSTFVDSLNGWIGVNYAASPNIAQRKGIVYRTTDGGESWQKQIQKDSTILGSILFTDTLHGYSMWSPFFDNFDNTKVYQTSDGGNTWVYKGTIFEDPITSFVVLSNDTLWALGGKISKSYSGATDWTTYSFFSPAFENGTKFFPEKILLFSGTNVSIAGVALISSEVRDGAFLHTPDGGENWFLETTLPNYPFYGGFQSDNKIWICGDRGVLVSKRKTSTSVVKHSERNSIKNTIEISTYPNPSKINSNNLKVSFQFTIPKQQFVNLKIFDIMGREIMNLLSDNLPEGSHSIAWNGQDEKGKIVASGLYFCYLSTEIGIAVNKVLLVK